MPHTSSKGHGGYFPPESMIWRVSREQVLMIGGGRALLMQAAHPLAMAGVEAHSSYERGVWNRLERTMSAVWTVVYGTRAEADHIGARVRSMHTTVKGRIPDQRGPFPAGTPYSAEDPELLLWVHATLVETALLVYPDWIGPLSESEQERYYQDMRVMAQIFGTPESVIPPTLSDFRDYMRERIDSDQICVTEPAFDVLDKVTHPPLPLPLRPAWRAYNLVTTELLPAKLREQYGLRWDPGRKAVVGASRQMVRRMLPLMPDFLRAIAPARKAENADLLLAA